MKKYIVLLFLFSLQAFSQVITPEIYSWYLNLNGTTGYNSLPANVQSVKYSGSYVYIACSDIPSYTIGPWPTDPNLAQNQNFVFKITRTPQANTGTKTATPLGHIGVLTNGVAIFNAEDANTYLNQGIWHQNAVVVEGPSMDNCLGHPQEQGEYHHHQNPKCLYTALSNTHSPIIGYAFDGFPIYGAYAYANTDGTGGIARMRTSYRKRNITTRTTLPDGSTASHAGPTVSSTYPLGYYVEDYEYVSGLGDLDQYNGRYCVTPEYPNGTYAYFATLDSTGNTEYPYFIGPNYYGVLVSGNTGPGGGHNTISETVQTFRGVVAYDTSFTLSEDSSKSFAVKTQASSGLTMSYAVLDSPAHGSLSGALPNVTYHPVSGYYGADTFQYTVSASSAKDTGVVSLTILQTSVDTLRVGQFSVNNQWNLVSVPVTANNFAKSSLFPTATSDAYSYTGSYNAVSTLSNGKGYWVKFGATQIVTINGTALTTDTINVQAGWNLIGSISDTIAVTSITSNPPNLVTSEFFEYNGRYNSSDDIEPGKGYWVKVNGDGQLVLSSLDFSAQSRINIVPTSELPPSPPTEFENSNTKIPGEFILSQNYPNPFNPVTVISYTLPDVNENRGTTFTVNLKIYNLFGQEIAVLLNNEQKEGGTHQVTFNANTLASGVYFYRLVAQSVDESGIITSFSEVKRMEVMK